MQAAGVHTIIAQFVDIHGSPKGKYIPLAHLDDVLGAGAGFSGSSICGTGLPRMGRVQNFTGKATLIRCKHCLGCQATRVLCAAAWLMTSLLQAAHAVFYSNK